LVANKNLIRLIYGFNIKIFFYLDILGWAMGNSIFLALALIGLLNSIYVLFLKYFKGVCFTGTCTDVPAIFGLLWFASSPLALKYDKFKIVWSAAGIAGIAILVSIELAIGAFCPFCTLAHATGVAMIFILWLKTKSRKLEEENI